ncbi:Muniscin C-terminal mu homology domain-containing protein [Parasitella parasitica]|nr:Muniscin C-terminal mu homology domain-containing protein [Parasitella parasitica]
MPTSNAYVDAFLTKNPREGISIAQTRLKDAMALDMEIAEYFKERSQIEDVYSKSLAKASKRLYTMDPGVLGHFAPIWELLLKEFNQVATYHEQMAHRVSQNIEKPLRASPSEDYHRLQQLEPLIQSFESKSNKLSSVKGTIFKKSKSSSSSAKKVSWRNEGVEYLNLHQKIDEARLTRLKALVEDFEKIQSEQLMKRVEMASITLSAAEVFNVQHDINDFCKERGKGLTTLGHDGNSDTAAHDRERSSTIISHDSHRSTNKFKSVFMKKKKTESNEYSSQHDGYSDVAKEDHMRSFISETATQPVPNHGEVPSGIEESISTPTTNSTPLVDAEGFSIPQSSNSFPTIASDISSRNASDDLDSDFQSLKLNQKLQINIKNDALHEESVNANESFNKMANMLRERTPTITRKARGRRDLVNRSQTESTLFSSTLSYGLDSLRTNSMLSNASNDTGNSNPFMAAPSPTISNNDFSTNYTLKQPSQSPALSNSGITLTDTPSSWLQPIPEVNYQQTSQHLHISILEKITLTSPDSLLISGQINISYHGPASASSVALQLHHIDGMEQLSPNPQFITQENGVYLLNTSNFQSDVQVPCFAYELNTSTLALPVQLSPSWKCIDGVSYLMIKHSKNAVNDTSTLNGSVQVSMPDQQVTNVQSSPQGIWEVTKHRLTWKLDDLLQQYAQNKEDSQQRLLAKFYVNGHSSPQPVHLNYQWHNSLASGLSVSCESIEIKQTATTVQSHQIVYI